MNVNWEQVWKFILLVKIQIMGTKVWILEALFLNFFFFIYSIFGLDATTKVYICLQINIFLEEFCCHTAF